MANPVFKRLADVAAEQNVSHETARRAALNGRIPAFQPFGKGTAWCVAPEYENFMQKARNADAGIPPAGDIEKTASNDSRVIV